MFEGIDRGATEQKTYILKSVLKFLDRDINSFARKCKSSFIWKKS